MYSLALTLPLAAITAYMFLVFPFILSSISTQSTNTTLAHMVEVVAVLTTSWSLVKGINQALDTIEQTREDARALKVHTPGSLGGGC